MVKSRVEDINFYSKKTIKIDGKLILLNKPLIMGIINCTPDSFFPNSRFDSVNTILKQAENQLKDGADIIDIGGYSSRPGAVHIDEKEESNRVIPAIKALKKEFPNVILSIDTFRGGIAQKALDNGATVINDIGAFELDPEMQNTLSRNKCTYILMHMRGTPQTMNLENTYNSLFKDISLFFSTKIQQLHNLGLHDIIIDPGFGFAKDLNQNFELLNHIGDLTFLNQPILVGISRKSMIYKKLETDAEHALNGTTILNTLAYLNGASILRVHDVKEAKEILKLL
jgi:dihydropteroate synthase